MDGKEGKDKFSLSDITETRVVEDVGCPDVVCMKSHNVVAGVDNVSDRWSAGDIVGDGIEFCGELEGVSISSLRDCCCRCIVDSCGQLMLDHAAIKDAEAF